MSRLGTKKIQIRRVVDGGLEKELYEDSNK